ncbi:hypothetical protein FKP32DRAFT_22667 [Trametes sanguinea]|nr:hypothetical protein FKP32DRAFT_22667 [Trametes sanguinea]
MYARFAGQTRWPRFREDQAVFSTHPVSSHRAVCAKSRAMNIRRTHSRGSPRAPTMSSRDRASVSTHLCVVILFAHSKMGKIPTVMTITSVTEL